MSKKKVDYKKIYDDHFGIVRGADIRWDEYEWIVNKVKVVAPKIHHIMFGASKFEDITNYMALSINNHDKAHDEELDRYYLREIHSQFMKNHPYI